MGRVDQLLPLSLQSSAGNADTSGRVDPQVDAAAMEASQVPIPDDFVQAAVQQLRAADSSAGRAMAAKDAAQYFIARLITDAWRLSAAAEGRDTLEAEDIKVALAELKHDMLRQRLQRLSGKLEDASVQVRQRPESPH